MKNLIFKIVLLILIIFHYSCNHLIANHIINKSDINKNLKILENEDTNQTLVFFPMVHVGKSEYYENCKKIIDSLRSDGFNFYYENLINDPLLDSSFTSTYNKKVRSILGYDPLSIKSNESLPNFYKKNNLVLQDYRLMGLTKDDTKIDLFKNQIIDSIESKYGPIILTECDFTTQEYDKYKCKSNNTINKFALTNEFRDPYISNEIIKLKDKKIVLIYGKMHWYFIYPTLKKNGFEITKGKI